MVFKDEEVIARTDDHMFKAKLNTLLTFLRRLLAILTTRLRRSTNSLKAFWHRQKKTILLILLVATITMLVTSAISIWLSRFHNLHFPSIGTIHTIGVKAYWDSTLQNETTETQWGTIYPGTSNNVTLYIRSVSNVPTILQLETANWAFLDADSNIVIGPNNTTPYMNLTWNYDNATLNRYQAIPVTLILTVDNSPEFISFLINNNIGQFSFDIIITANET